MCAKRISLTTDGLRFFSGSANSDVLRFFPVWCQFSAAGPSGMHWEEWQQSGVWWVCACVRGVCVVCVCVCARACVPVSVTGPSATYSKWMNSMDKVIPSKSVRRINVQWLHRPSTIAYSNISNYGEPDEALTWSKLSSNFLLHQSPDRLLLINLQLQ